MRCQSNLFLLFREYLRWQFTPRSFCELSYFLHDHEEVTSYMCANPRICDCNVEVLFSISFAPKLLHWPELITGFHTLHIWNLISILSTQLRIAHTTQMKEMTVFVVEVVETVDISESDLCVFCLRVFMAGKRLLDA